MTIEQCLIISSVEALLRESRSSGRTYFKLHVEKKSSLCIGNNNNEKKIRKRKKIAWFKARDYTRILLILYTVDLLQNYSGDSVLSCLVVSSI